MFGAIGTFVYRFRFAVIAVLIVVMGGLGLYGLGLDKHLSQSGFFDDNSQSVAGSQLADTTFGRDHKSDIVVLITPPAGTTVDNPQFGAKVEKFVDDLVAAHPDVVNRNDPGLVDPFTPASNTAQRATRDQVRARLFDQSRQHAFISIGVAGDDDTTVLNNYKKIEPFFDNISGRYQLPGTTFQLAGLQPIANAMSNGMADDVARAEIIALPLVAIMLFFIFGGVVAAILPVLIGGLTIAGSTGIMTALAQATELNIFARPVITLIGLGIAIDYGLFIVSRFREELAEGYPSALAVRRAVMTAGQTVVFSATIIVAALACLLIFPQGFLKSVAYGAICAVALAATLSITVLPAILGILGRRIDMLGFKFLRRTKTRKEVEEGFWGKLAGWVMRHPIKTAVPTILLLLVLILPFTNIAFGGITEKYLPPGNDFRVAQEDFDRVFPTERTEEIKLVIRYDENSSTDGNKLQQIADEANKIPGFTKQFSLDSDKGALTGSIEGTSTGVVQMSAGLRNDDTAEAAVKALRSIDTGGLRMYVAGTPALTQDSIDALLHDLPLMAVLLIVVTFLLMFLQFGSVVLPIKAALMSALGLGSTLGILTWIFIDGHGASIGDFTPGPLMSAVLVLIIAIIYGLSTDYEVFLLSRMVEARQKGATTTEAIRSGTAHTGRIITAAAAILVVVTGAFGLSEIVMMKYIAYGMIAALILDATVIRMLLVPSIMKLLGDDCWWAPNWMRVIQRKIGLGEKILDDEPGRVVTPGSARDAGSVLSQVPTTAMAAGAGARVRATPVVSGSPQGAQPAGQDAVTSARRGPVTQDRRGTPRPTVRTPEHPAGPPTERAPQGYGPRSHGPQDHGTQSQEHRDQGHRRPPAPEQGTNGARNRPTRSESFERPAGPNGRSTSPATASDRRSGETDRRSTSADMSTGPRRSPSSRDGATSGPDTGGWSLGDSGIRLGSAIRDDAIRDDAIRDDTPSTAGSAGTAVVGGYDRDGWNGNSPVDGGSSNGSSSNGAGLPNGNARPSTPPVGDTDSSGRRHDRGGNGQISVQELLRRNTSRD